MPDVVVRHANYGLELVDELTGTALLGSSRVSYSLVGAPVPSAGPVVFELGNARWVFEDLAQDVVFQIQTEHYLPRQLQTGLDLPAVPTSLVPGVFAPVALQPRAGYPFPPSLTRAIGSIKLDASLDPLKSPVVGAQVVVTPKHGASPAATYTTFTDEGGQYVVWFEPDPTLTPAWSTSFDVAATAVVDIGGVPTPVAGNITAQPIVLQTFNGADIIYMT